MSRTKSAPIRTNQVMLQQHNRLGKCFINEWINEKMNERFDWYIIWFIRTNILFLFQWLIKWFINEWIWIRYREGYRGYKNWTFLHDLKFVALLLVCYNIFWIEQNRKNTYKERTYFILIEWNAFINKKLKVCLYIEEGPYYIDLFNREIWPR